MKYLSTRGHPERKQFCQILLEGLAPDGGLYLPESYPQITASELHRLRDVWTHQGYADLAYEILSLYVDDIPHDDLRVLCRKTYTEAVYGTKEIVPLKKLKDGLYLEALSNGPTLAFKDMAMQLLGHLFEYELARRGESLNILGATSGDTGSAAEYAMRGKRGVRVFMTSPAGRMSPFQQAQMFSLMDENIHNIAIEGVFDDCQDIVKAVSNDHAFKAKYKIGTVNSINWARLLAQVVYYFAGYFQATKDNSQKVSFTVPSGNFGNVCAGHVTRMMGLPIENLVVATNENDVLDEFFKTGVYRVRGSADTHETSSPSMDISKASNFERFVFDMLGCDGLKTQALFDTQLKQTGQFDLSGDIVAARAKYGFSSGRSTHQNRLTTIKDTYAQYGIMIDTHTADGVGVALEFLSAHPATDTPMIVLETALPIKFAATIVEALGIEPYRPVQFEGIEALPKRVRQMPADAQIVKNYIATTCQSPLLLLDDALAQLMTRAHPLGRTEWVDTFHGDGRVLAEDVVSELQVPPQDNSAMDGYAVCCADVVQADMALPISQRIPAGVAPEPLKRGTTARIFTGANIPEGADAVVMQEDCEVLPDGRVFIKTMPKRGLSIRRAGQDVTQGAVVLARGTKLSPAELGLAASVGRASLMVALKPSVALFSTGDELVMPGAVAPADMKLGSIYNSNRFFLRALLTRMGCEVTDLGIVPDNRAATIKALSNAAVAHDLILTSGGVSVGEEDHIKPAVQALGELDLWQIAMKPGKPFAFGKLKSDSYSSYFVGLPGNPVSSFVTFMLLVRPLLLRLQGANSLYAQPFQMRADFDLLRMDKRREFVRVCRNNKGGLDLFSNQSSGVLTSVVWGDGFVDNPAGQIIKKGDWVSYYSFAELLR